MMEISLSDVIKNVIRSRGPITFERFMDMALYYPEKGYYNSYQNRIGRTGDFYTSPHLHEMFGAILARQVEECWELIGRPEHFMVVEQGAGRGYLALDLLNYLKGRDCYKDIKYFIIEISPKGLEFQRDLLREHEGKVCWVNGLDEIGNFQGCYLSNELVDAFPVHIVTMDNGLQEVFVDLDGDHFVETLGTPSTNEIVEYMDLYRIAISSGYRTEVNLRVRPWINTVTKYLDEGFVITIDYGYDARDYYREERDRGTLLCYFRHQVRENPFEHVGEQDITAHVNFSDIKKWGEHAGLRTLGYCAQGTYLVSMGLDEIIIEKYNPEVIEPDENYQFEMAKIKGLITPGGMGESHKVMIQYKGDRDVALRGFTIRNRLHIL